MAVDHDRHTPHEYQDYIDRAPTQNYASGWGVVLGILALVAILGMLFIGIGNSPDFSGRSGLCFFCQLGLRSDGQRA